MPGLNSIMDASLSAMFAAQAGMATSGHNIANANTPGFNRQNVTLSARRPAITPYGAIGLGVEIQGIRRIQDDFLANNLRVQSSQLESYAAVDSALYEVEAILGSVDNDRIGNAMDSFFKAWNTLANPPVTPTMKVGVVAAARTLVDEFHSISDALDDLEANIEDNIQNEIRSLNGLLAEAANMNEQIMSAESNGEPANDLRDQRDLLLGQIAEIAEISTLEREDGTLDIILAGRTMVTRGSVTLFDSRYTETSTGYKMTVVTQGTLQEVSLSTGRLEGLLNSRDVHVTEIRSELDAVAKQLIDEVNALHTQGRTESSAGLQFFTGNSLHTIGVNPVILDNKNLVATGRTATEGDVDLAMAIAHLATESLAGGAADSVGDTYRNSLTNVASQRSSFEFMVQNQQNVVAALQAKVASVSGVSLDEEGANLVRYQNSYNAAAKVISTVQEMYDTLLNMV